MCWGGGGRGNEGVGCGGMRDSYFKYARVSIQCLLSIIIRLNKLQLVYTTVGIIIIIRLHAFLRVSDTDQVKITTCM